MDYEKKYNEALERAKKLSVDGYLDAIAVEEIFPELRESEDERIRKELLSFIESVQHSYLCATDRREKWIAYLEKQKYDMMKPIYDARESFESALEKAWNDYHNGYENVDKLEDDYVECAHAKGFREGYLFGLEKQKEQKPAEWSEEDEDMLNSCISSIEEAKENRYAYKETDGDTSYDREIAFLKSLRPCPSWKPSEEQLNALYRAAEHFQENHFVCTPLLTLYEQLKKL